MKYEELPVAAQEGVRERFPGLSGPLGAGVLWKAAGDPTGARATWTGFEGGRLIATLTLR